jgi:hypothetical protein
LRHQRLPRGDDFIMLKHPSSWRMTIDGAGLSN